MQPCGVHTYTLVTGISAQYHEHDELDAPSASEPRNSSVLEHSDFPTGKLERLACHMTQGCYENDSIVCLHPSTRPLAY